MAFIAAGYNATTDSYVHGFYVRAILHLAATLKKLLTIFLILLMTANASGYFYGKPYHVKLVQEADEKNEKKGVEEKKTRRNSVPILSCKGRNQ